MANKLSVDKKVSAVGMLCEGSSIRSVETTHGHSPRHGNASWRANRRRMSTSHGSKDAQSRMPINSGG